MADRTAKRKSEGNESIKHAINGAGSFHKRYTECKVAKPKTRHFNQRKLQELANGDEVVCDALGKYVEQDKLNYIVIDQYDSEKGCFFSFYFHDRKGDEEVFISSCKYPDSSLLESIRYGEIPHNLLDLFTELETLEKRVEKFLPEQKSYQIIYDNIIIVQWRRHFPKAIIPLFFSLKHSTKSILSLAHFEAHRNENAKSKKELESEIIARNSRTLCLDPNPEVHKIAQSIKFSTSLLTKDLIACIDSKRVQLTKKCGPASKKSTWDGSLRLRKLSKEDLTSEKAIEKIQIPVIKKYLQNRQMYPFYGVLNQHVEIESFTYEYEIQTTEGQVKGSCDKFCVSILGRTEFYYAAYVMDPDPKDRREWFEVGDKYKLDLYIVEFTIQELKSFYKYIKITHRSLCLNEKHLPVRSNVFLIGEPQTARKNKDETLNKGILHSAQPDLASCSNSKVTNQVCPLIQPVRKSLFKMSPIKIEDLKKRLEAKAKLIKNNSESSLGEEDKDGTSATKQIKTNEMPVFSMKRRNILKGIKRTHEGVVCNEIKKPIVLVKRRRTHNEFSHKDDVKSRVTLSSRLAKKKRKHSDPISSVALNEDNTTSPALGKKNMPQQLGDYKTSDAPFLPNKKVDVNNQTPPIALTEDNTTSPALEKKNKPQQLGDYKTSDTPSLPNKKKVDVNDQTPPIALTEDNTTSPALEKKNMPQQLGDYKTSDTPSLPNKKKVEVNDQTPTIALTGDNTTSPAVEKKNMPGQIASTSLTDALFPMKSSLENIRKKLKERFPNFRIPPKNNLETKVMPHDKTIQNTAKTKFEVKLRAKKELKGEIKDRPQNLPKFSLLDKTKDVNPVKEYQRPVASTGLLPKIVPLSSPSLLSSPIVPNVWQECLPVPEVGHHSENTRRTVPERIPTNHPPCFSKTTSSNKATTLPSTPSSLTNPHPFSPDIFWKDMLTMLSSKDIIANSTGCPTNTISTSTNPQLCSSKFSWSKTAETIFNQQTCSSTPISTNTTISKIPTKRPTKQHVVSSTPAESLTNQKASPSKAIPTSTTDRYNNLHPSLPKLSVQNPNNKFFSSKVALKNTKVNTINQRKILVTGIQGNFSQCCTQSNSPNLANHLQDHKPTRSRKGSSKGIEALEDPGNTISNDCSFSKMQIRLSDKDYQEKQNGIKGTDQLTTAPPSGTCQDDVRTIARIIDDALESDSECPMKSISNLMTPGDIKTLSPNKILSSIIIESYLLLIEKRDNSTRAISPLFFNDLNKSNQNGAVKFLNRIKSDKFKLLLIPVNFEGHWALCVVDSEKLKIGCYDSVLTPDRKRYVDKIKNYLTSNKIINEHTSTAYSHDCVTDIPVQNNHDDCGVFVLMCAEHLSRRAPIDFKQEDMPVFRRRIVYELLRQDLLAPSWWEENRNEFLPPNR